MTKNDNHNIVMTGRSATSFISKAEKPSPKVCARTNQYFAHVNNTTSVSQRGGVILICSSGERFNPK